MIAFLFREKGWTVHRAEDGTLGLALYQQHRPDLVLLDLGLPGIPGLDLFARIRALRPDQPLIMLTALGEEDDRVRGMEAGADDYICKPFNNRELVARALAVLRRTRPAKVPLTRGPLRIDPAGFRLNINGTPLALPRHEFALLHALMRHPDHIFTRERLMRHMYDDETDLTDRAVDAAVTRLRRKLKRALPGQNVIDTLYGLGYRLSESLQEGPQ